MQLKIDNVKFNAKPGSEDFGSITHRMSSTPAADYLPNEILISLSQGQTIMPGVCTNGKSDSWQSQQLFLVDIDGGLPFQMAQERWQQYDLEPCFAYHTFSNNETTEKFRIAWALDSPVTTEADRKTVLDALFQVYPECDTKCKNPNRLYCGTNQDILYQNTSAVVSLQHFQLVRNSLFTGRKTEAIIEGSRNDTIFKFCCALRRAHIDVSNAKITALQKNQRCCIPPLDEDEVERILLSAYSYQDTEWAEKNEYTRPELLPFHKCKQNKQGEMVADGVFDERIVQDIIQKKPIFSYQGNIFVYDKGVYGKDGNGTRYPLLSSIVKEYIYDKFITDSTIARLIASIQRCPDIYRTEINCFPKHYVFFQNCIFDALNWKLVEHSPQFYNLNIIPHDFSLSEPPKNYVDDWLEWFAPDAEDRKMLMQYLGYCFTADNGQQKMMVLQGAGCDGKSTLISLLQHTVGDCNCSFVSLQELSARFSAWMLTNKLLNVCADLPSTPISDASKVKQLTGDDTIVAEEKGKPQYSFRSYAKMLFSTNKPLRFTNEATFAFARRLLIFKTRNTISSPDDSIQRKLYDCRERFTWLCMKALHEMYAEGRIYESPTSREEVAQIYHNSDSVKAFLDDCTKADADSRIKTTELYTAYKDWAANEEIDFSFKKKGFYENLAAKGIQKVKINGIDHFKGIKITKEIPPRDFPF